jgi:hypothetical protein
VRKSVKGRKQVAEYGGAQKLWLTLSAEYSFTNLLKERKYHRK